MVWEIYCYNEKNGVQIIIRRDHTLFIKKSGNGKITILIVYVDDIIVTGDDLEEIGKLKKQLAKEFEIKELGQLK